MYKRDHYLVYSHSNCIVSLVFEVAISTGSSWNRFCKLCLPQCIRWWQCQCSNYRWSFGWKIVALDISLVFNFALNTWQCKSHDCLFVAEWFLSDTKSSFLFTNSIFLQTESKRLEKIVKNYLRVKNILTYFLPNKTPRFRVIAGGKILDADAVFVDEVKVFVTLLVYSDIDD